VQVPGVGESQRLQAPPQAESQHTPSAQKPLWHIATEVHAPPGLATHTPLMHFRLAAHPESAVQLVGQVGAIPSQTNPLHAGTLVPASRLWQVPGTAAQSPQGPQAESQHTPSAQKPLRQAPAALQELPGGSFATHWLCTQ